jgi:hypothetical protein
VQFTISGGHASLSVDTDILLEAPTVTIDADTILVDSITFPATQVPSADVHTLDDYEEGTAVVALTALTSGTITLNSIGETLAYTKIGRLVHLSGRLYVSSVSSPVGILRVTGLPFAAAAGAENRSAAALACTNLLSPAATVIVGWVNEGTTNLEIYKFASGAWAAMAADVQANSLFIISVTYHV